MLLWSNCCPARMSSAPRKVGEVLMDIKPGLHATANVQHWDPSAYGCQNRLLECTGGTLVMPMTLAACPVMARLARYRGKFIAEPVHASPIACNSSLTPFGKSCPFHPSPPGQGNTDVPHRVYSLEIGHARCHDWRQRLLRVVPLVGPQFGLQESQLRLLALGVVVSRTAKALTYGDFAGCIRDPRELNLCNFGTGRPRSS